MAIVRIVFIALVIAHGLIHSLGFFKAFGLAPVSQLTQPISRLAGVLWLLSALLFLTVGALLIVKAGAWWVPAVPAVVLSQALIIASWGDAKFGTIANLIIAIGIVLAFGGYRFEAGYRRDVDRFLGQDRARSEELLTEADLEPLPGIVRSYLRSSGAVGRPKVRNMWVLGRGRLRSRGRDFFSFTSEQYNLFAEPTRLYFIKGAMYGLTVPGYHRYAHGRAAMNIRLFGLVPVVKASGGIMDKAETVTVLNDMCLMAPPSLIDRRIRWETIDDLTVKAVFTNGEISVSAVLFFDAEGRLRDFRSDDRSDVSDMRPYPFSTPVHEYGVFDGRRAVRKGDAVWHYPDGPFTYGEFEVLEIRYNVGERLR